MNRPRLFGDPMSGYNVRLTAAMAIKARRLGNGNMGEGIRIALMQAEKTPQPVKTAGEGSQQREQETKG